MRNGILRSILCSGIGLAAAGTALADSDSNYGRQDGYSFNRVATLANYINNDDIGDQTVSEIVAATKNGKELVYTDGELGEIGFININNPANPIPLGKLAVGGEPTSVAILGNNLALVAVNTSESFVDPSGRLVVVRINQRQVIAELELGGQPDAIAISPDGKYAAIAIENERDEEVCVGGSENGAPVPEDGPEAPGDITEAACEAGGGEVGIVPQTIVGNPPGFLAIVDLNGGNPQNWEVHAVALTGLATLAPTDPEPEFVDINDDNLAVVTLQENNHIAIVDLESRKVVRNFDLGTVDLEHIDAVEDDDIILDDALFDVPREPDAVQWVDLGYRQLIATADEGDFLGGSRGFTLFRPDGSVFFSSGNALEQIAVEFGHYPEGRSENKGSEPESIEFAHFRGKGKYLFVGSERGSFIAVYRLDWRGRPEFVQLLPGPLGPEGLLAIPKRGLLIASGEEDDPTFGVRSTVMIYQLERGSADYPQIRSARVDGKPIPFAALSGMDALPNGDLVGVWDSFYGQSKLFRIDVSGHPALVTEARDITGGSGNYDPEGVALAPDGTLWIASEGNGSGSRLNRLLQTDATGAVLREVFLPAEIEACRQAERDLGEDENGDPIGNVGSHGAGFEGVAILPGNGSYRLAVAQQRGWDYTTSDACEVLDDNPGDSNDPEPDFTRIWIYDPTTGSWDHVPWELAPVPANASWSGLSEITRAGDGHYVLIERDNRTGDFAELKTLVRVHFADAADGITADEKAVYDLLPHLEATNGWITDKPEGVAIDADGRLYVVTDNDGVDDWSGETWFLRLGDADDLFAGDDDGDRQRKKRAARWAPGEN